MFSIQAECQIVLLADNKAYNGLYTIIANPKKASNVAGVSSISIGSILINYKSSNYLIDDSNIVKVKFKYF